MGEDSVALRLGRGRPGRKKPLSGGKQGLALSEGGGRLDERKKDIREIPQFELILNEVLVNIQRCPLLVRQPKPLNKAKSNSNT